MPEIPQEDDDRARGPWPWSVLIVLTMVFSVLLFLAGLPSPALFGALAAGLAYALITPRVPQLPGPWLTFAQAVLGASIGASLNPGTVTAMRQDWFPVLLACLATLLISVAAGYVLALRPGVSRATGVFAMIAGGASGVVAISRDLGADDRVVAVVQYLRVLIIMLGMPLVAQVIFDVPGGSEEHTFEAAVGNAEAEPLTDFGFDPSSLGPFLAGPATTVLCLLIGLPLARLVRIPAGSLLFPMVVAAGTAAAGLGAGVPGWLQGLGFALIGLQVGLRFTRQSLKLVLGLLPLALSTILGLIGLSAGFGVVLAEVTGQSMLDGYLATTPGGLYAVLATAVGSDADVTFVLTVQIARLFVMLLCAPLLGRLIAGRRT